MSLYITRIKSSAAEVVYRLDQDSDQAIRVKVVKTDTDAGTDLTNHAPRVIATADWLPASPDPASVLNGVDAFDTEHHYRYIRLTDFGAADAGFAGMAPDDYRLAVDSNDDGTYDLRDTPDPAINGALQDTNGNGDYDAVQPTSDIELGLYFTVETVAGPRSGQIKHYPSPSQGWVDLQLFVDQIQTDLADLLGNAPNTNESLGYAKHLGSMGSILSPAGEDVSNIKDALITLEAEVDALGGVLASGLSWQSAQHGLNGIVDAGINLGVDLDDGDTWMSVHPSSMDMWMYRSGLAGGVSDGSQYDFRVADLVAAAPAGQEYLEDAAANGDLGVAGYTQKQVAWLIARGHGYADEAAVLAAHHADAAALLAKLDDEDAGWRKIMDFKEMTGDLDKIYSIMGLSSSDTTFDLSAHPDIGFSAVGQLAGSSGNALEIFGALVNDHAGIDGYLDNLLAAMGMARGDVGFLTAAGGGATFGTTVDAFASADANYHTVKELVQGFETHIEGGKSIEFSRIEVTAGNVAQFGNVTDSAALGTAPLGDVNRGMVKVYLNGVCVAVCQDYVAGSGAGAAWGIMAELDALEGDVLVYEHSIK